MLTPKENARRLYSHEKTEYMPIMGEGIINNTPVLGYHERPAGGRGGEDWFGVHWSWKEGEPAPMPAAPYLLDDICDWKDVVRFPDLERFDWEEAARTDRIPRFDRENNLLYQMIHNGLLERLQNLMPFEEALCALLTDPDEVEELFAALADYKCRLIEKIAKYYKPDIICYHDDWGTQRGLMCSPETWRELIKKPTKQIVDYTHSLGIKFELHSDGLVKELIPEVVEDLKVDGLNIMAINDIPELKKITGKRVVYDVFVDTQKYDVLDAQGKLTEEQFRSGLREDILQQARGGSYIPCMILVRPDWQPVILEELHHVQELLKKEEQESM
jgi:hypothetical protein